MEKTEKIFKPGDKFQMTGLDGTIKSVEVIDVSEHSARVICGSEKAKMPLELLRHLDGC